MKVFVNYVIFYWVILEYVEMQLSCLLFNMFCNCEWSYLLNVACLSITGRYTCGSILIYFQMLQKNCPFIHNTSIVLNFVGSWERSEIEDGKWYGGRKDTLYPLWSTRPSRLHAGRRISTSTSNQSCSCRLWFWSFFVLLVMVFCVTNLWCSYFNCLAYILHNFYPCFNCRNTLPCLRKAC